MMGQENRINMLYTLMLQWLPARSDTMVAGPTRFKEM